MNLRVEWVPIGELRVSRDPQAQLVTVTGPCVALALCDPEAGVAGLLHVVLPGHRRAPRPGDRHAFYADTGVPLLVDEMVRHGACRDRLQAAVVGGAMASPPGTFGDLGRLNVEAVAGRLQAMGIPLVIREALGQRGRRITLTVSTGAVSVESFTVPATPEMLPGEAELPPKQLTRVAREVSSLRPDPGLSALVMEELHRPHQDWSTVRRLMGQDPVLAAHFFRLANSPAYGHPQEIASMEEALNLLGGKQLRRIWVLAATGRHSGGSLKDWGLDHRLWSRHGLASAVIARYLAAPQPPGFREEAFTAGLLHGLGLVGLACLAINAAGPGPDPPTAYPGCGAMGGLLLSAWNLPPRLARAVAGREAPGPPGEGVDLAVFIQAACGLSTLLGFAVPGEPLARPLSPEVMAQVGLGQSLAGALPGILAELRPWGLLDMGKPDDGPAPEEGEA
jgi:chemotaxis receptor (MCP) glutamine deamidase CheD/HD-like signal output (HDOD) protein